MRIQKDDLFVIVVKDQEIGLALYQIAGKIPQCISYQEQLFSKEALQQAHIFDIPLLVDTIRHFLLPHNHLPLATFVCVDTGHNQEIIFQQKETTDNENTLETEKHGKLILPSCCDTDQRTYLWKIPYELIMQYTIVLTLLRCRLIAITLPLQSLIYFNHRHGGTLHQFIRADSSNIRDLLETRCLAYFNKKQANSQGSHSLLSLYSFASACMGAHSL